MNCRRLARMCVCVCVYLSLYSRDHTAAAAFNSSWRTFLSRLGSLTISLFPLRFIRSRAHSLVRALSGVCFFLRSFVRSLVLLFYSTLRRRSVSCVSCLFIFLFGSAARCCLPSATYQTIRRYMQPLWHSSCHRYYLLCHMEVRASAYRPTIIREQTYLHSV